MSDPQSEPPKFLDPLDELRAALDMVRIALSEFVPIPQPETRPPSGTAVAQEAEAMAQAIRELGKLARTNSK
jgi:hypothetical protein